MNDDNSDLAGLDPDNIDSVVKWSREHQFRSSPVEPQPDQQDTQAQHNTQAWVDFIDERIRSFVEVYVEQTVGIIAEEIAETYGKEIHKLRADMTRRVQLLEERAVRAEQNARKVTIIAPALDVGEAVVKAIGPLQAQIADLQQQLKQRNAEVLDLPSLPRRRA